MILPNILDCSHNQWRNWTIQKLHPEEWAFNSFFELNNNQWNHLVISYFSGLTNIYVNGINVNSININTIPYSEPLTLNLGKWSGDNGTGSYRFFTGYIDDIRISNNIRYTENFIPSKNLIIDENTISYWKFDSAEGDILYDHFGQWKSRDYLWRNLDRKYLWMY